MACLKFVFAFVILVCFSDRNDGLLQEFNVTCYNCKSQSNGQSQSFDEIRHEVEEGANVQINILISELQLNTSVRFTGLTSLTIGGKLNFTSMLKCTPGAGIVLRDISDTIKIHNLKLLSCGSRTSIETHCGTQVLLTYVSALTIIHCRGVELDQLYITKSRGVGLTILDHQGGNVSINSSVFEHSGVQQEYNDTDQLVTGGMLIQMSCSLPTQNPPILFHFDNCTFENNSAHATDDRYIYTDAIGTVDVIEWKGKGGGVNLMLGPGLNNTSIRFKNCYFVANQAFHGSGLAVNILGDTERNTKSVKVEIFSSIFHNNGGKSKDIGFGGGAYMVFYDNSSDHTHSIVDCNYVLNNVTFTDNLAENGGGVYFLDFSNKQVFPDSNSMILFSNCTFERNMAHTGSAIALFSRGHLMIPMFQNCQFVENKINNSRLQSAYGKGTIYIHECVVRFSRFNIIKNNLGSGIHIVNGVADFQDSSITFMNNTSLHGGALVLIESSSIIIGPNNYEFIHNSASFQGGAIYVRSSDDFDFTSRRGCFLQYADSHMKDDIVQPFRQRANVTFVENKAAYGQAIFATSFRPCQMNFEIVNLSQIFSSQGIHVNVNTSIQQHQLATEVAMLSTLNDNDLLEMMPGKRYYHQVFMTDDLNNSVSTSFRVAIEHRKGDVHLVSDEVVSSVHVGSGIQLRGKPGAEAGLILETISSRDVFTRLKVKLADCPPGYTLDNNLQCVCNAEAYIGLFKCHDFNMYSSLLPGYWAGIIDTKGGSKFVTSACRFYAEYNNSQSQNVSFEIDLPDIFSVTEIDKIVCGETRTGVGCGKCRSSHTVYFHSPNFVCKQQEPYDCNLGWLFYILSELLPVTLIFITVLLLNIKVTSGTVNGFILFSQLLLSMDIDASGIIVYPQYAKQKIQFATDLYQLIYGFLNLNIFNSEHFSFCLMKSATALDTLAFKYITILYIILLIVAVALFMNKFKWRCLGNCHRITDIKISVIHGISTFLVLCYSQCIEVSIGLLIPLHIHIPEDDRNFTCSNCTRVWFNGELIYFHRHHLLYALPALFCLLTIGLLPPILLLIYPLFNKILSVLGLDNNKVINNLSEKLPVRLSNLKPLFDSFQSCFKDNLRFFAGLYFLYRWTLLFVYFVKDFSQYYTTVGTILLLILMLHTIFQPYSKKHHNLIDALLFANLLLINSLSSFNFQKINSRKAQYGATVVPAVVQLVLIYLPLVIMLVYLFCKSFKKLQMACPRVKNITNVIVPERIFSLVECTKSKSNDTSGEELIHDRLGIEYSEYSDN